VGNQLPKRTNSLYRAKSDTGKYSKARPRIKQLLQRKLEEFFHCCRNMKLTIFCARKIWREPQ
jgi:hypothetical protein